jgi:selenocysteine lyase/cysteine desulfurase
MRRTAQRRVGGKRPVFLDGPGGTQVPQRVLDAIVRYLTTCNANQGGVFTTSRESDAVLHEAHQAAADLLNAPSADEIVFGALQSRQLPAQIAGTAMPRSFQHSPRNPRTSSMRRE